MAIKQTAQSFVGVLLLICSTSALAQSAANPDPLQMSTTITLPNGLPFTYFGTTPPTVTQDPVTGDIRVVELGGRLTIFGANGGSSASSGGGDPPGVPGDPTSGGPGSSVPEPEMAGLFVAGAVGLILARRRRRKV